MFAIQADALSHKQGAQYLIRDINWCIAPGEHWLLFGLNGCGKTTLLSILAGYRAYSAGTVSIFGEPYNKQNAVALRRQIGFISSSYFDGLLNGENVLNIVLSGLNGGLNLRHTITDHDVHKAKQILKDLGLKSRDCYPYDMLSKGQRQKVLIARALMPEPKVLILDEPCSGLDIFSREYLLNTITQIATEIQTTIIYVTHYPDEILPIFTKAALMHKGLFHSQGDIKEIINEENLSDFFAMPTEVKWTANKVAFHVDNQLSMPKEIWNQNNGVY